MPQAQAECQDTSVSESCCSISSCCQSCFCCASKLMGILVSLISLVWIALAIAEIVIGSVYLHNCPAHPYIPIYLIVNGVTVILICLLSMIAGCKPNKFIFFLLALLSLFWFAWLITGSVWTFPFYPNYETCNRTVYLFTFAILIIQWIVLGLALPAVIMKLLSMCSSCSSCSICSRCASCCCCSLTKY